jgi:hypothetical protein
LPLVASAALLHCCYWSRLKWVPVTPPFHSSFVAHLLFFASRVCFFFGGALFSAIFFRHIPELDAFQPFGEAVVKILYVAGTLFGLFCYSLELDRLGKAIEEPPDHHLEPIVVIAVRTVTLHDPWRPGQKPNRIDTEFVK